MCYLVPEAEKMQLLVEGTLHGEAFAQTLDIQPQDVSGTPQGVKPNYRYTVKLDGKSKEVQLSVTVSTVEEWTPAAISPERLPGAVPRRRYNL